MGRFFQDLVGYLQDVAWALILLYLFLAGIAMIFGRCVGYEITPWVCLGFALVITAIFAAIILANLLWNGIAKIFKRLFNRSN